MNTGFSRTQHSLSEHPKRDISLYTTAFFFLLLTLPKGFEYDAVASVECDAGKVIESRESRPDQRIKVADGLTPVEMTFVIPGPRCALWVSH